MSAKVRDRIIVAAFILGAGILVAYGLPYFKAAHVQATVSAQALPAPTTIVEPPTVDLPYGQKFVYMIPAIADGVKFGRPTPTDTGLNIYVTVDRPAGEKPQRFTFYQPGYSPHSWSARLYIQEH